MPCHEDAASIGEGWEKDPAKCVSDGALMLEEYKAGPHILLKKNPNFQNADNVNPAGVRILFTPDATTSLQGYEASGVNATSTPSGAEIPCPLAEDPNFSSEPALGDSYFQFNIDADVVNDFNAYKALSLAIDRSTITDQILCDDSIPASTFVTPPFGLPTDGSMWAPDENRNVVEEYETDPYPAKVGKAQAYLTEVGYPGGVDFPELSVSYYDSGNSSLIVEAVQQMWQESLGTKVNLQVQEYAVFTSTINSGDWNIAFIGRSVDYNDPMTMLSFFTVEGVNDARWHYKPYPGMSGDTVLNLENEAYDNAVEIAVKTPGEEYDAYPKEAEDALMESTVICPIYYTTYTQVIDHGKVSDPGHTPVDRWDFQYHMVIGRAETPLMPPAVYGGCPFSPISPTSRPGNMV